MEEEKKEQNAQKPEQEEEQMSAKEERIRKIALAYYFRPDIRKAMFEFSQQRECVPRYFEGFGKRPDAFQFDSDIIELAKKGATSFHCSEELWRDPLQISTELNEQEFKKLRNGWDLLIDVDSKYLDYSKIYAEILIEVLRQHGIKNIGVKFSGSKGWHIIIPFKAFPEEISGKKTCEMFPEWPRLICQYINSRISEKLKNKVLDIDSDRSKLEVYCSKCGNNAQKKTMVYFSCPFCRTKMQNPLEILEKKRKISCVVCGKEIIAKKELLDAENHEISEREDIFFCDNCHLSSRDRPENFRERVQSRHIDADIVLVSPRHLFRMPYSLHEKTSLASVVIDHDKIKDFDPRDADPMKIVPKNYLPDSEPGEATTLLRAALEFRPPAQNIEKIESEGSKNKNSNGKYKEVSFVNVNPELYPPSIKKILEGMKSDGRKRALFILLSFFKSLKIPDEEIKNKIEAWNNKNYDPLKAGYIKAQLVWYAKTYAKDKPPLPPNFDKSYYKDIGVNPTPEEMQSKNPVNYVRRKMF